MLSLCLTRNAGFALIAILALAAAAPAQATLVGYWPLDGNATGVVGGNGVLNGGGGGPSAASDRNGGAGGALAFDGDFLQYVEINSANSPGVLAALNTNTGSTSMWVAWNGDQDSGFGGTFGAVLGRQENGIDSTNVIYLDDTDPANADVGFRPYDASTAAATGGGPVGTSYHHIATSFTSGSQQLYVDGVLIGSGSIVGGQSFTVNPALTIGAWIDAGGAYSTSSIDEVGVFDENLGEGKAKALFFAADKAELLYTLDSIQSMFDAYDAQGSTLIGNLKWNFATPAELTSAGLLGPLGEVTMNSGQFGVLFDTGVGGLIAQPIPEPSSMLLLFGLGLVAMRRNRRRRR